MPVSMQLEEKKHLLIKAFNEGTVVIIDEINSSPMMERLLNNLLMGKPPEKPGFMVIGTQNPISMAGRHASSNALARRLIKVELAPSTQEEMQKILCAHGVETDVAGAMASAYLYNMNEAKRQHLQPLPTFRDLLRTAKQHLESVAKTHERQENRQQDKTHSINPNAT